MAKKIIPGKRKKENKQRDHHQNVAEDGNPGDVYRTVSAALQ